jgi:hypothetical protein
MRRGVLREMPTRTWPGGSGANHEAVTIFGMLVFLVGEAGPKPR